MSSEKKALRKTISDLLDKDVEIVGTYCPSADSTMPQKYEAELLLSDLIVRSEALALINYYENRFPEDSRRYENAKGLLEGTTQKTRALFVKTFCCATQR